MEGGKMTTQPSVNIDEIVQHYMALRANKAEMEARHKEEIFPIARDMDTIEAALLKVMQSQGVESVKTPHGTPYIATFTSAKVSDFDKFLDYVAETQNWDLLERRVNKTAFLADGGQAPGVETTTTLRVNIRSNK
jgi:hypothetical protein